MVFDDLEPGADWYEAVLTFEGKRSRVEGDKRTARGWGGRFPRFGMRCSMAEEVQYILSGANNSAKRTSSGCCLSSFADQAPGYLGS